MPIDPWATTSAQEFRPQEPDIIRRIGQAYDSQQRETFDSRQALLARISDVYENLHAKDVQLDAQDAQILAQQEYLASLITKDATAAGFNTGTLTADSTDRYVGTLGSLSIDCPTGKLRIVVSCQEASIDCGTGTGAVIAYLSFSVSGLVALGDYDARLYTAGTRIGASLSRTKTLTVPPGTYTVSVQAGYWCAGFAAASINFADMDLSAEVVNAA